LKELPDYEVEVVKLKRQREGGQGKTSEGMEGVKRVTKGSGQEGVNFSCAGLGPRGKWYWEEDGLSLSGTLCSYP
jgi:hypothetical protein